MFKNASSAIRATTDEGRLNGLLGTNSRTPDILKGIGDVSEAFSPYINLINLVAVITEETLKILENIEYNKKTCKNLIDRIQAVEFSVKILVRRREENEKNFRDDAYFKAFYRLVQNLEDIKNFVRDVSKLSGLRKFTDSGSVKKRFNELIKEYDQNIIDLHFTKCVADEEQLIEAGVTDNKKNINIVLEQISLMWQDLLDKIDESTRAKHTEQNDIDDEDVCVPKIEDIVLEDPKGNDDTRGRVLKKYYKHYGIYVACKSDKFLEEKQKGFPRYIAFLKKIRHEVKESQDEYLRIMKEDSACRPTFQKIVLDLNNLITKEKTKIGDLSWLRHRNEAEKALKRTPSPSKADQIEGFNLDSKTPPSSSSSIKSILSKTSMIKGNTPETKQPSKIQNIPTMLVALQILDEAFKKEPDIFKLDGLSKATFNKRPTSIHC
ncbi:3292_t:CDS:2 [Entrophospora sp. SA101]|nr:3292_t:CDS:2 [Entrophospora sp. SA101]